MPLPPDTVDEVLASFRAFRPPSASRPFVESGQLLRFDAGQRVLEEGEASRSVYAILSGTVGVFYSAPDGSGVLVKIFGPPAMFGEMELPFSLPRMEYVEVLEPAAIVSWEGEAFLAFLRGNGAAAFAMFEDLAARLCISAYLERSLAFHDVATRTAGVLLSLLDARGSGSSSAVIPLRLTYQTIARCVGATEKSVERTIGRWLKEGWLKREDGRYLVLDLEALREKADPDLFLLTSRLGRGPATSPRP